MSTEFQPQEDPKPPRRGLLKRAGRFLVQGATQQPGRVGRPLFVFEAIPLRATGQDEMDVWALQAHNWDGEEIATLILETEAAVVRGIRKP